MPRGVPRAKAPDLTEPAHDGTQTDLVRAAISVFSPEFDTLNLFQKIARITGMLGGVEKRGYNAFHKYHYVTEADLVTTVRQYLAAAGIVIIPNAHTVAREGELTSIMVEYTVTDGNESFTFSMPGYGSDRGDKGVYKAITGSNKYALMKLFKIETGDDPESDTRVDERAAVAGPSARPTEVTGGDRAGVTRGGHAMMATPVQIRRISELMKEEQLERPLLVQTVKELFDITIEIPTDADDKAAGQIVLKALQAMTSEQAGGLLMTLSAKADAINDAKIEAAPGPVGHGY